MQQLSENGMRTRLGRTVGYVAASLVFAAALSLSNPAHAAHGGGGGGFHGGGFGGFHGGGFHGGFHGGFAGVHSGFGDRGFHDRRGVGYGLGWGGLGWGLYPGYGYYGYGQPYAAQYWYYCSDPVGYYPQVTQCNIAWQTVPAG